MSEIRKVGTSGNSLAVRIPRKLADQVGLLRGNQVLLDVEIGPKPLSLPRLVVRPFTMQELTGTNLRPRRGR